MNSSKIIWKLIFKIIWILKLIIKWLLLYPVYGSFKIAQFGVNRTFDKLNLAQKQYESIEKIFEYVALYLIGQNLFLGSSFQNWYKVQLVDFPNVLIYMPLFSYIMGILLWLIAFTMKGRVFK